MFDENLPTKLLWTTQTKRMILALEALIKMSKKYDVPIDYERIGVINDEKKSEDSPWGLD